MGVLRSTPGAGGIPIRLKSTDAPPMFHQKFEETDISINLELPPTQNNTFQQNPVFQSSAGQLMISFSNLCDNLLRIKDNRNKVMINPPNYLDLFTGLFVIFHVN